MRVRGESVTKSYRDAERELVVLREVNFDFPSGASVAIVGRSGIGKSTLLHVLGGLDRLNSGSIWYDQAPLSEYSDARRTEFRGRHIGFVFQFHHLLPEFSAIENISMPLLISGHARREAEEKAQESLRLVGLTSRGSHRPNELSGGEQQRVAIARALVAKPAVLLADEPTGNLDVDTSREIQDLLRQVRRETGCTLILVTHNIELARSMDQVLEMHPGGALTSYNKV